MNNLDNNPFDIIIKFLNTEDYLNMTIISKQISVKTLKYKKTRKPYITIDDRDAHYITEKCKDEMHRIEKKFPNLSDTQILVKVIIKLGDKKCNSRYKETMDHESIHLYVVPWMFRNSLVPHCDNCSDLKVCEKTHMCLLLDKMKKKLEDVHDCNERMKMELVLFRKLLKEYEFVKNYTNGRGCVYMNLFSRKINQF